MINHAIGYVPGTETHTLIVFARDADTAYEKAREVLFVERKLVSASLRGTCRRATEEDVTAARKEIFHGALQTWMNGCQKIMDEHHARWVPGITRSVLKAVDLQKFVRVIRTLETGDQGSCEAFVAKETFSNRTLGHVKIGDVFKPASWKAPAKHARGNIFNDDHGLSKMGPYGPAYLSR